MVSLTPRGVLEPVYSALRHELAPHSLVLSARSRDGVLDAVARAEVILSPHLAGSTSEARHRMISSALRNLDRVLRGGAPEHVVNGVDGLPRRA